MDVGSLLNAGTRSVQSFIDKLQQGLHVEGLREISLCSGGKQAVNLPRRRVGADDRDGDIRGIRMRP